MKRTALISLFFMMIGLAACNHHRVHKAQFYSKMGEQNATDNGYHHNEAQRLLDYNEQNKAANEKHAQDTQEAIAKDLGELNKPNKYSSKTPKKKKKKFSFYH